MSRWNRPLRTVDNVPEPKFFVPPETPYGSGATVTEHPAGFRVRTRGDTETLRPVAYRCPVHGEFSVDVRLSEQPESVECHALTNSIATNIDTGEQHRMICGRPSPWAGSTRVGIGHAAGEVMS